VGQSTEGVHNMPVCPTSPGSNLVGPGSSSPPLRDANSLTFNVAIVTFFKVNFVLTFLCFMLLFLLFYMSFGLNCLYELENAFKKLILQLLADFVKGPKKPPAILILKFQATNALRIPYQFLSKDKISLNFLLDSLLFLFPFHPFIPPLDVYFCVIPVNPLLMMVFRARFFVKNVLYYSSIMAKAKLKKIANDCLAKSLEKRKQKPPKKIFNFDGMVKKFHEVTETFPDCRRGKNISKDLKDAALGGFAVFYTQSPSFLSYQKTMQETRGQNNAASLFGIKEILSDNHIRNLMDEVAPSYVSPMFSYILDGLNNFGYLDRFRSYNNNLLVALDGTGYFSSPSIHCSNCNQTHHKNGKITYSHSAVTPVVVKPGANKVISLEPEHITPQDGHEKQDCENAAAKRWLRANGSRLKQLGVTITGDDLYCKQPLCELILDEGLDFILVCKEESHRTLYEYVEYLKEDIRTVEVMRWKGKRLLLDTYRFLNGVPLRDGEDALEVNWCELVTTDKHSGMVIYKNAFATNFEITEENVKQIVADGRARWKIENENNNVLKTKGYHLEHNFGHGKKHLSALLMTFNLLAFLFHTVLELMDEKYQLIRRILPTRKTFFQDIRALTRYMYFGSWDELMLFMILGLKLDVPQVPKFPEFPEFPDTS